MKRLIKKSLYKIFVSLFVIFYTFVPQSIAIGQVIEEYSQDSAAPIEEVIIPEESLPEEEVTLPEEVLPPVVEEPLTQPVVEPEEVIKEVMHNPTWVINGNTATTFDTVQLGKTYISPQNSKVRVFFTKLPENPSTLTIEEITLTEEEIEATGAISNKAYDIKTDMINGTFEYDLILPSEEENTKVVYVENRAEIFTNIKEINTTVIDEGNTLKIEGLDHFTLFIPANGIVLSVSGSFNGVTQVTVAPSTVIEVDITVQRSENWENNDWESTSWSINGGSTWTCVNTPDNTIGQGTDTESFDITAPATIGTYSVSFRAHRDDNCGSTGVSNTFTLIDGIIVQNVGSANVCNNPSDSYSLSSSGGIWTSVNGGSNVDGQNTEEVKWGNSAGYGQSGLRFDSVGTQTFNENTKFLLGTLTHKNYPINNAADGATLQIKLSFSEPAIGDKTFSYYFGIEETPNSGNCPSWHQSSTPCDDKITFPNSYGSEVITINDIQYTLVIDGFVNSYTCESVGSVLNYFITEEQKNNSAYLVGHLSSVLVEKPEIRIIKKTNGQDISAAPGENLHIGDTVTWQYVIQNSGNVELTNIIVTDNPAVTIDCGGQTTLASGLTMNCTASGTVQSGQFTNTATVVGTPPTGGNVTDSDSSWYFGIPRNICGDGVVNQASEMCDNGSQNGSACTPPYGTNGSPASCNYCDSSCQTVTLTDGFCGDNIVNGPEECDGTTGVPSGYSCSSICTKIRNTGTITVDKITNPSGDQTNFPFTVVSTETNTNETFNLADQSTPWSMTLPTGVYTVSEGTLPTGWTLSNTSCVSDQGPITKTFDLDNGENVTCTFTNTKLGSISGTKWEDMNGDGDKDAQDLPILGWTIKLDKDADGSIDHTTTTDNDGVYTFSNLLPGTYKVIENTPSPWNVSFPSAGVNYYTGINLTAGANLTGYDFGNYKNGQIKGYKWIDVDGDGIKETGEGVPTSQWQIQLWKEINGVPVDQGSSVSTDPTTGAFNFGVTPGTYYLSEVLPTTGWTQTQPSAGSRLAPDRVTRLIGPIVVTSGSISEGNNFGNFKNVSITVCKWKDLDGDILTEDQTAISGWSISLIKGDDTENINTKSTEANGCAQWLDMGPGSYKVTEKYQTGWTNLTPTTHDFGTVQSGSENFFKFINTQQPITIKAYKIVCTDESQLPNWGTGGPNITANTAQDWVNSHNTCSFVDNWNFQWGNQTASNPGDNTGETSVSTWHKFGPTVNGLATVEIPATEIEGFNSIWMREAWNSNYIPFTYNIVGGNSNNVTAEIYCHTDALNYDNLDRIDNIQNGDTYYCVAWNVVANPGIEVEKSGPDYAINGENITYKYEVTNKGNVPLTTISVTDDKCTPVQYKSGDDGDSLLENGETWKYECTTTIPWTFPTAFTNKAEAKGYYFDRELKDDDEFTLYPFTLRKDVLLYWDGDTIQYSDPNTGFNVDIKNGDTILGTKTISESSPLNLWLSDGTYHFCEKDLPLGYIQGYDGCINYTTGQGYPDWSQINVITFDLAIDKIAPSVAYKGETITYEYKVTNSGPASVTPVVEDKLCPPIYVSGDADIDGKVDPSETWKYTCDYVVTESGGATITNTATVHDQEGEGWDYTGWYLGGDINLVNNTDTENTPVRAGSIRVCKLVLTPDGQITNGSEVPGFNFSITGLNVTTSQGAPAGVLPQTSYSTPLTLNTNLYSSYSGNDVYCKTYDDLSIGHFYYGEESYENPWNEPKYNDSDLNWSNAISYSGELFDADSTNDGQRNTVGDGDILLTKSRLDRTLLVVNQYPYSSIQGRKYYDVNINGNFDSDEKKDSNRLNGWTINLYDNQWNLKQSMVTGNDNTPAGDVSKGQFRFENVLAGTYYVCEEPQTGWYQTEPSSGIQHNGLYCHTVNLGYAEDKTEIQFGNYQGSDVNICKKDNYNRSLSGWDIVLASEKVQSAKSINVSNSSGTSSSSLPAGIYLIKVSGTYRYGNTQMIADAGFSYRPLGIPYGTGGWVSGLDLSSKGLMAWVNGSSVNWGAYDSGHVYTYVYEHNGGPVNISIYDDNYGDNVNSNFTFEIFKVNTWAKGTTERNGCVTLKAVPYGQYILDEYLKDGWVDISGKGLEVTINDISENFTIKNRIDAPVTIKATKIVCDYEEDLPNWGAIKSDGNPITQGRIDQFLSDKEGKCRVVPDWEFEWAYEGAGNPGDEVIGYGGGNWNTFGSSVQIDNLLGGRLELREVLQENYIPFTYGEYGNNSNNESAEFYCYNDVMNYDNWEWLNTPEYGQTYYCVGFNTLTRTDVYGYKWLDIDRDGDRSCIQEEPSNILEQVIGILFDEGQSECEEDDLEPRLSGWKIFIDTDKDGKWDEGEQYMLTSSNTEDSNQFGSYLFEDLLPGEYKICEEMPEGWAQTYPGEPAEPSCHTITLPNDCTPYTDDNLVRVSTANAVETYCEFNFGNVEESELYISETNNSWPNTLRVGDTFKYIIKVRALKGPITDVILLNLPHEGFVPQSGTFSAISDVRGALSTSGVVYASPGEWDLGDMIKDEVITISYTALVTSNVHAGIHPDISSAHGTGVRGLTIFALAEESDFEINKGILAQNFVGTQVRVGEDPELEGGEVLGASITLPATGADTYITLGALISMIIGFLLMVFKPTKKHKTYLMVSILLLGIFTFAFPKAIYAQTEQIQVQMAQPVSPTNKTNFNIGFVALSIPSKPIEVQCQKSLDGITFVNFGTAYPKNTGNCVVDNTIITGAGTYSFRVVATVQGTSNSKESNIVAVQVGLEKPSPITEYSKSKGTCTYTLKFKSTTSKVQIYRSDNQKSFYADDTTLITKPYLSVTPNVLTTYTDSSITDCTKEYYYAIRSLDDYNNVSTLVTDDIVTIVRTPAPITPTPTPVDVVGEPEGQVAGEEITPDQEEGNGEVKGEEEENIDNDKEDDEKEEDNSLKSIWSNYKYFIIAALVVALGSGAYTYVRRKR